MTPAVMLQERRRQLAWLALLAGIAGLSALGGAWWYTSEPAPAVRVWWRDEISADRQAALERRYLLSNRRAPHPDAPRSFAYDLLDTRRSNIEQLVTDPGVRDTNDIDRQHFVVGIDRASGERWMWAAHRTPGLRDGRLRWTVVTVLVGCLLSGWWSLTHGDRVIRR